jgi:dTDP-4-dehydrorhamnose 3,5-epimerase
MSSSTYGRVGSIHQVLIVPLRKIGNQRGHLMEVQCQHDSHHPGFGQAYITATLPGVVKAWYRHHRQIDQIAIVKGKVIVVLYDTRDTSPTQEILQEILLDEGSPKLVQIPPGIWHGFKALAEEPSLLLHLNTIPFDFANPDEDRLAPDHPSIPYCWSH